MKSFRQLGSSMGVSLVAHVVLLLAMWQIRNAIVQEQPQIVIDSIINEERDAEDFTKELEETTEVAETLNFTQGGKVSTAVGGATGPTLRQTKVEMSQTLDKLAEPVINPGVATSFGDDVLGEDLGEGQVTGEVGAVVESYGAALGRMTQELLRLMREKPVHVVWLFDQSHSMRDDQQEIKANFHKVYEELGIVSRQDEKLRRDKEVLLTTIAAYSDGHMELTRKPTADINEICEAIDKIPVDEETGKEDMCEAIQAVLGKYGRMAQRQQRRLVIVLVSDESGTDGDGEDLEQSIGMARQVNAPIYVMGRESIFGYPYARITYVDPKYNLTHWLTIDRGPETAYPEQLQWDGLHARWDGFPSGFGPYKEVRLARDTGGIFFILPGEEEELTGVGAHDKRKFHFLDLKEYQPLLVPRMQYAKERDSSEFRNTVWQAIVRLNPNKYEGIPSYDKLLNISPHRFPLDNAGFRQRALQDVLKAQRAMELLNIAVPMLEKIKPLRDREPSQRWRANYDLVLAQCIAFRVRLFQFLLAMDKHANNMPQPKPQVNKHPTTHWDVGRTRKTIEPDEAQFERLKKAFNVKKSREEYLAYLQAETDRSTGMYREVIRNHPNTPWARRAQYEIDQGFGMAFHEAHWHPNYDKKDIKLPKP